jgi:hypothetical protein
LGALIAEAEKYDNRFGAFADLADELTDQFWAMHYPGGEFDEQSIDFEEWRKRIAEASQTAELNTNIMNTAIFLGTYPSLTREMLDYEIQVIREFVNKSA